MIQNWGTIYKEKDTDKIYEKFLNMFSLLISKKNYLIKQ